MRRPPLAAAIVAAAIALAGALAACTARVDGPADDHAARDRAAGAELAAHLGALPGVARASVVVTTPWRDPLAPAAALEPSAAPAPAASVALALAPNADADRLTRAARDLVAAALHADPAAVVVAAVPAAPAAEATTSLGPFEVAAGSRGLLEVVLLGAFAAIGGLAAWVVVLEARQRRRGIRAQ